MPPCMSLALSVTVTKCQRAQPEFDSPCAWGRWCFAMEPWGWGYHPDWQVQLDTCRNSLSEVWIDQLSINSLGFCVNLDWLLRVLAPQI